ncbi:MAG: polyribonucleotide nucleotidyltransferase [Deltaproteobacteria bacterium]|nr:MAG: polyribonucleotide nucleotidyltransferase [Deltaproteobacteria bacterium]
MQKHSVSVEIGGRPLIIETGWLAKQAHGAVVVRQNESAVLVTVVGDTEPSRFDFLPLTVNYEDRNGAYGTIPGGFLKREGRANERETLISRLIDRPIRPQFPKHYRCETQVIATALSYDEASDTDVLAMCGAAAAIHISDLPMKEPIAGVRIARIDGEFVINPDQKALPGATLTLIVAGTADAVCMVEGGAKEASEVEMMEAMDLAHAEIKKIIGAIHELRELCGVPKREIAPPPEPDAEIVAKVEAQGEALLRTAMATPGKHERAAAIKAARNGLIAELTAGVEDPAEVARITSEVKDAWSAMTRRVMRQDVIDKGVRLDGRATDEIRPITSEVTVAPRAHGSAVFTRGETQVFATAALGIEMDAQRIDFAGAQERFRRFMLTYNFPPFCTGEARMLRGPKRREIGHGALAHRALSAVVPGQEEFPYVIRICADVLESNGSSSMATVCAGCLAMMDAGVPLKAPVAGIAMGLIKEGDSFAVLSDILGDEDHLGDMDFKVTGTRAGITAFQMDTKISGVPREVMLRALSQAREGRIHILDEMAKVMEAPREGLSKYAPRITTIKINTEKIRDLIGPGGRTIRGIQDQTGVKINVENDGTVMVAAADGEAGDKALALIREITQEAEIGKLYLGVVKKTVDFGAFVEIFPGTEGLVHISQLANERVERTTDVVHEGDEVLVRVIDIDRSGKIRLSRKEALEASGM